MAASATMGHVFNIMMHDSLLSRTVVGTRKRRSKNLIKAAAVNSCKSKLLRLTRGVSKPDDFGTDILQGGASSG